MGFTDKRQMDETGRILDIKSKEKDQIDQNEKNIKCFCAKIW